MKYLDTKSIPEKYDIYLKIDLLNDKFNGYNLIKLKIIKSTNIIEFHSLELNIEHIEFEDKIKYYQDSLKYDDQNDIYKLELNKVLEPGYYLLKIVFNGVFNTGSGLVKYVNKTKNNRTVIFTRFEPNYARKCFPCWDEPHLKVIYNMSIEINDPSYKVYFNTDPVTINQINDRGSVLYKFEETIRMSTYVSSFMIGKFNYVEAYTQRNVRLRVYIPSDVQKSEHLGLYALDVGIKVMDFITEYFQIPYPFNKMDFIPIDNVDAKGMENFGLIFYDAPWLLYDKKVSTLDHKMGIANVIAHEIAHQWFGNLITMFRWDELWLKESFAKFFEYYIVEKIYPEWNIKSFFISNLFRTLENDSISLKSVKVKVKHNKHLIQIYDDITYFKGASLLFMLIDYLGEDYFKQRMREYLDKYKYVTITSLSFIESLCEKLIESEQIKITNMIKKFISNKGIPVIRFGQNFMEILSFNTRNIINDHINNISSEYKLNSWIIPIKIKDNKYLISNETLIESYSLIKDIPINNNKNVCYYRIAYNDEQFKILLENINNMSSQQDITSHQHMSILNDLYILGIYSLSKFSNWIIYINKLINHMCTYDQTEKYDYYLFNLIYNSINKIASLFKTNEEKTKFFKSMQIYETYLLKPLNKLVKHMIKLFKISELRTYIENDLSNDRFHYNKLVFYLLDINKLKLKKLMNYFIDNNMFNLYGDLNQILFKYIMINDDVSYLNKLNEIGKQNKDLYPIIITSFKYAKNHKVIDNIFNKFKQNNKLDFSNSQINQFLGANKYFTKIYTDFFINNYDDYIKIFPLDSKSFMHILNQMILSQTNPDKIEQLLNKLNMIDNTKFILKMKHAKYILFNKLFLKINIIKKLNYL